MSKQTRAAGVCRICGQPATPGKGLCPTHYIQEMDRYEQAMEADEARRAKQERPTYCDACGKPIQGGYSIGGTILCRQCQVDVGQEIERLRAEGSPVNAMHIARRMLRKGAGDYLLRDIPADLWADAQRIARERGQSLRELILDGLRAMIQ